MTKKTPVEQMREISGNYSIPAGAEMAERLKRLEKKRHDNQGGDSIMNREDSVMMYKMKEPEWVLTGYYDSESLNIGTNIYLVVEFYPPNKYSLHLMVNGRLAWRSPGKYNSIEQAKEKGSDFVKDIITHLFEEKAS